MIVGGVYAPNAGWQPTVVGTDERGELVWERKQKAPWHLKMFPVRYEGDFSEHWMWKSIREKSGLEWGVHS